MASTSEINILISKSTDALKDFTISRYAKNKANNDLNKALNKSFRFAEKYDTSNMKLPDYVLLALDAEEKALNAFEEAKKVVGYHRLNLAEALTSTLDLSSNPDAATVATILDFTDKSQIGALHNALCFIYENKEK